MNKISDQIKSGARAFLVTEYKYLCVFVLLVCIILVILYTLDPPSGSETDGVRYAACFLMGAMLNAYSHFRLSGLPTLPRPMKRVTWRVCSCKTRWLR